MSLQVVYTYFMGVPREKSLDCWDAVSARHVDVSMSGANLEQQILFQQSILHRVVSLEWHQLLCRRSMQLSTINQRHDSLITSKFKMFWENNYLFISNIVISIVFLYSWEAQNRKGFKLELTMKRSKVVAIIIWYFHCNWSEKQQLLSFFVWLIQLLVNRFVLSQTNRLTD